MKSIVEVKNLSFSYDGKRDIIKNLSFKARQGELLFVLGPNGSGKSTLLELMLGLYEKREGEIYIGGREVKTYSRKELAKKIATVRQRDELNFDFSVTETVMTGRYCHMRAFQEESELDVKAANDAMKRLGVYELKDKSVLRISGGERQRVMLAKALCQDSDIILMDEALSNADLKYRISTMRLLKELCGEGKTVIMTAHDINMASEYSDRILLLKDGVIYADGKAADVINKENIRAVYDVEIEVRNAKIDF